MTKPNGWTGGPWTIEFGDTVMAGVEVRKRGECSGKNMVEICKIDHDDFDIPKRVAKANLRLIASAPSLYEALSELLAKIQSEGCHHESTYRGGTILTFCDDCGQKWADDENGGFIPYAEPTHIAKARAALSAAKGERDGCE